MINRNTELNISHLEQSHDTNVMSKNIHKIYLVVAVVLGLLSSVINPIFNEPDSPYHFEASANMVGLVVDISRYGSTSVTTSLTGQSQSYADGTHFEKYYLNEAYITDSQNFPREIGGNILNYAQLGHIIPALGIWIGYHIYPSIGVMVVFGRLLSSLIYSLLIYFIIKKLKRGKLTFTALMLSPVIVSQFSSFSYDALSYVLVAASVAVAINVVDDNRLSLKNIAEMVIVSALILLAAKLNFKTIIVIYPLIVVGILFNRHAQKKEKYDPVRDEKTTHSYNRLNKKKSHLGLVKISAVVVTVLVFLIGAIVFLQRYGGIFYVLRRLTVNLISNVAPPMFTSLFVSPYRTNSIPIWVTISWCVLLVLCLLSEEKFVKSKLISHGALLLLIVNILAVYFQYMISGYYDTGTTAANQLLGAISGVQGRYFTPLFLLLVLFVGSNYFKAKIKETKVIVTLVISLAILSNIILIVNNFWGVISG
jgi:uncharacterized membrane protein